MRCCDRAIMDWIKSSGKSQFTAIEISTQLGIPSNDVGSSLRYLRQSGHLIKTGYTHRPPAGVQILWSVKS